MKKQIKITYLKKAYKFLQKTTKITEKEVDKLVIKLIKKVIYKKDEIIDFKELKGNLKGKYRIRKGKVRIIATINNNEIIIEAIIENIDVRGNIY